MPVPATARTAIPPAVTVGEASAPPPVCIPPRGWSWSPFQEPLSCSPFQDSFVDSSLS